MKVRVNIQENNAPRLVLHGESCPISQLRANILPGVYLVSAAPMISMRVVLSLVGLFCEPLSATVVQMNDVRTVSHTPPGDAAVLSKSFSGTETIYVGHRHAGPKGLRNGESRYGASF